MYKEYSANAEEEKYELWLESTPNFNVGAITIT